MNARRVVLCAAALLAATPAGAHRLDEYLQATTIAVEKGRVQLDMRLTPGVAVFPAVFAGIDSDADGAASMAEQRAYAQRVQDEVSLMADGVRVPLRLVAATFAAVTLLQEGRGQIELRFEADVPPAATRRLTFENHHERRIGVYLVNALMPRDADIRLGAEQRSDDQSLYQLDYADASAPTSAQSFSAYLTPWGWLDAALVAFIAALALVGRRVAGARVQ